MKFGFLTMRVKSMVILLGCAGAVHTANAAYPEKPVRWIIPGAAGGSADSIARAVATAVSARWGQPIIIDNKPGATGIIANDATAKAVPDGYTWGQPNLSTFVMANLVAKRLPYQPTKDFTPIAKICTTPYLLTVTPSLPVKSVSELIAHAKAHPNELFYGSSGTGSSLHVLTELFRSSAGITITHTPYKSNPAAEMDLAAGQIQMMIGNLASMAPHVKAGRLRALAITGPKRSPLLPDVPTMAQAGIPAAEMVTWVGVMGPAKMPAAVVSKIHAEVNSALADPKLIKQLADMGCEAAPTSIVKFDELIKSENEKWGAVIKKSNITAD